MPAHASSPLCSASLHGIVWGNLEKWKRMDFASIFRGFLDTFLFVIYISGLLNERQIFKNKNLNCTFLLFGCIVFR